MENNAVVEGQEGNDQVMQEESRPITRQELNEALEVVNQLKSTNDRLLNESREYKEKFKTLQTDISNKEKTELEKSGDLQALLEKERTEKFEYQMRLEKQEHKSVAQALKYEVAKLTGDAYDIDDVISNLGSEGIDYDKESDSFTGLKEAIETVRERKKYLFATQVPVEMVTTVPTGKMAKPVEKTLSQMSRMEKSTKLGGLLTEILKK